MLPLLIKPSSTLLLTSLLPCLPSIVRNLSRKLLSWIFLQHCLHRLFFSIEPVRNIFPNGQIRITPDLSGRQMIAHTSYVNSCTGLSLASTQVSALLQRMALTVAVSPENSDEIHVHVPPTRPDILHECDIMEDAAIAYGFNNLPHKFPHTSTVAKPLTISKLCDVIRIEWAFAGWVEVLPLILVS
jgi:phenylalanyl-tRNA synthetase beta chain